MLARTRTSRLSERSRGSSCRTSTSGTKPCTAAQRFQLRSSSSASGPTVTSSCARARSGRASLASERCRCSCTARPRGADAVDADGIVLPCAQDSLASPNSCGSRPAARACARGGDAEQSVDALERDPRQESAHLLGRLPQSELDHARLGLGVVVERDDFAEELSTPSHRASGRSGSERFDRRRERGSDAPPDALVGCSARHLARVDR